MLFGIVFPTALHNDCVRFLRHRSDGPDPADLRLRDRPFSDSQCPSDRPEVACSTRFQTAILFAFYAGALSAANALFANSRLASSRLFLFGVFLVVIPTFEFLRRRLQNPIDRLFFREKYDYQKAMLEISEAVAGELDLARVFGLSDARGSSRSFAFPAPSSSFATATAILSGRENRDEGAGPLAVLARFLQGSSRPRDIAELKSGMLG